jgi:transcriptional regulator with XRE-family HTH domain
VTVDEIRRRLCIAMQVDLDYEHWLEDAEHACIAHTLWSKRETAPEPLDLSTIGSRIRCAREICGMSIKQCAARAGIRPGVFRFIEEGKRDLPGERFLGLCLVLGVSRDWLLGESEEGGPPVPLRVLRLQASPAYLAYCRRKRAVDQARRKTQKAKAMLEELRDEAGGAREEFGD